MIEVTVNPEELPSGHSAGKVYEDEVGDIYLGGGNTIAQQHKNIITANFKFGLRVTAGQTLIDKLKAEPHAKDKSKWSPVILCYTMAYLAETGELFTVLQKVMAANQQRGFRDGVAHLQAEFRKLMDLAW